MRQAYIPDKRTYEMYKSFFQTGSGYDTNGYIYSVQNGSGIGGFLRNALKFALPIGKKLLYKGYELAKPELKKVANSAASAATRFAEKNISNASHSIQDRLNTVGRGKKRKVVKRKVVKRKVDALGS